MSRVGVVFGSRSVEHEVSVITAQQVMAALPPAHTAVPIYIAKDGRWWTGTALRELSRFGDVDALLRDCTQVQPVLDAVAGTLGLFPAGGERRALFGRGPAAATLSADVAMPLVHGSFGEDGTLQGLLEMGNVPYTGSGVAASAVAMDKRLAKSVLRPAGLPVLDDVEVRRDEWRHDAVAAVRRAEGLAPYPLFVKPVTLGSSIGVSRAADDGQLRDALELALTFDDRCLVEAAQDGIVEVNCAVIGDGADARPSLLEQPASGGVLTYDDKYRAKSGKSAGMKSARRLIPAPLDGGLTERLQAAAVSAFAAVGAAGVARVDLMVRPDSGDFVVNEVNPIPGSLAFYLFEPAGVSFGALLDEMIAIAMRRSERRRGSTLTFDRWMLEGGPAKSPA